MKTIYLFLGGNTEKYIPVIVPTEKEATRIDKNGDEITKNKCYILQCIDSPRFMMESLLSNLVDNHFEGIHIIKCNFGHGDKKIENVDLNILQLFPWINKFLRWFNRMQIFVLQQKLSTRSWWKVKATTFSYIQIF